MIPRAKQYQRGDGAFSGAPVFPMTEAGEAAALVLSRFLPSLAPQVGTAPSVTLACASLSVKGAYTLSVKKGGITATYGEGEGLRNAMATLSALYTDGGFSCAEIADAPAYPHRSVMLDLARGYVELPILYEYIVRAARLKYNYVHLHLMDGEGYAMASEVLPDMGDYRRHSREELSALCRFASELSVEIIPEIEFPAHATALLRARPDLMCDVIDEARAEAIKEAPLALKKLRLTENGPVAWGVCLGKEETYRLYRRILAELAEVFPGEYIHIGGDEISCPDLGAVPHWDNCHACRARMRERGLSDMLALYHDGITILDGAVRALGKRMIKWNDQREMAAPPPIPRDIVIEYWKPSCAGYGDLPPEGIEADMRMLTEAGFTVINAHCHTTYHDQNHYMTAGKMNAWSPAAGEDSARIGGETCAWELGNLPTYAYLACRFPIAMALFADRLWNRNSVPYDGDYRAALLSSILGKSGLGEAPLSPLAELLPPVPHSPTPPPRILPEAAPAALSALTSVRCEEVYGRLFLEAYRAYLLKMTEQ